LCLLSVRNGDITYCIATHATSTPLQYTNQRLYLLIYLLHISFSLSKNIKVKIHRTVILPGFFYGCETWSLTLREERRLSVSENRVLRRVFDGPKRDEVTGEWRKLHKEELYDSYCLPNMIWVNKSRRMRWAGHVAG